MTFIVWKSTGERRKATFGIHIKKAPVTPIETEKEDVLESDEESEMEDESDEDYDMEEDNETEEEPCEFDVRWIIASVLYY